MFKIVETREEKRENILYWDQMRMIAQRIRDENDRAAENTYHSKFMTRLKINERPDFMEPCTLKKLKPLMAFTLIFLSLTGGYITHLFNT